MPYSNPSFPTSVWDGTSEGNPDITDNIAPTGAMHDKLRAEVMSLESVLSGLTASDGLTWTVSSSGITLALSGTGGLKMTSNGDGIVAGNPVTTSAATSGKAVKADKDDALFCGLATEAADTDEEFGVIKNGLLTMSDWTDIVGSATLTAGEVYYVSSTPGQLSTTAPSTAGEFIHVAGVATSTTTLFVGATEEAAIPTP